jgi:hypothetical protein
VISYEKRTKTTTRVEYVVPSTDRDPLNHTEFGKVYHHARLALLEARPRNSNEIYDDEIFIEPTDEGIVIWFETDSTTDRSTE